MKSLFVALLALIGITTTYGYSKQASVNDILKDGRPLDTKYATSSRYFTTNNTKPDWVKKVHIVSMNHLDVGYNGIPETGFINTVLRYYFHEYFPRALKVANQLKQGGYVETFIYTTHAWLVSMYLDCPPNFVLGGIKLQCPTAKEKEAFVEGIKDGYINWHAAPLNMEPEFAPSPEIFSLALNLSFELDERFGIKRPLHVMSQRDVPGLTQTVLPILLEKGITGLTVGVNGKSAPPAMPSIFRWNYQGSEVVAMWHPGGYPHQAGTVPRTPGGISLKDCVIIPEFPEALCFAFRNDNQGPPMNVEEVLGNYEVLRAEFPNAKLQASKFEDFVLAVQPIKDKLPVLKCEVGDTWIQGVASDPRKSAEVRAVGRVMRECFRSGKCDPKTDERVWNSSRIFIKTFEHTWGLHELKDMAHWTNTQFAVARKSKSFSDCEVAWAEQRQVLYYAIDALGNHSVVDEINQELAKMSPQLPDLTDYTEVQDKLQPITSKAGMKLQFGVDGSLKFLSYKGVELSDDKTSFAQFVYQSYNETDYVNFRADYIFAGKAAEYYKHNATACAHPVSRSWPVTFSDLYISDNDNSDIYVHLTMADNTSTLYYGAPSDVWIHYKARSIPKPGLDIEVQIFNKTTTRLAESLSFNFSPKLKPHQTWMMSKLGGWVDPMNVVLNGSQYEHVLDDNGIVYRDQQGSLGLQFRSLELPLAVLSTESQPNKNVFPAPLKPLNDTITGVSFNIFNNIWDTNYIFWYPYLEDDRHFKARLSVDII